MWKILLMQITRMQKRVDKAFGTKKIRENIMMCMFKETYYCYQMHLRTFKNMYFEIYELDPAKFLSAPGLAWQAALKETKIKLDLLIDIAILLIAQEGIRGGIYHSIYRYAKANNKYMKNYDENKEASYLQYWDVNNLYA